MTTEQAICKLTGLKRAMHDYVGLTQDTRDAFDVAIEAMMAQEIIHCRDCEYKHGDYCGYDGRDEFIDLDHFCGYGRRREDGVD